MKQNRIGLHGGPLTWKRRHRIASGGFRAESHCGRYRVYDFFDGTFGAAYHAECWKPIERRKDGLQKRYRTRAKAQSVAEAHNQANERRLDQHYKQRKAKKR